MVFPAICAAATAYFAYYTIWGTRGVLSLADANAMLAVRQEQLAGLKDDRSRLAHRIQLMAKGRADPDLIEEVAHDQLLGGAPDERAVPRKSP